MAMHAPSTGRKGSIKSRKLHGAGKDGVKPGEYETGAG